jgi:hypothetical protein
LNLLSHTDPGDDYTGPMTAHADAHSTLATTPATKRRANTREAAVTKRASSTGQGLSRVPDNRGRPLPSLRQAPPQRGVAPTPLHCTCTTVLLFPFDATSKNTGVQGRESRECGRAGARRGQHANPFSARAAATSPTPLPVPAQCRGNHSPAWRTPWGTTRAGQPQAQQQAPPPRRRTRRPKGAGMPACVCSNSPHSRLGFF